MPRTAKKVRKRVRDTTQGMAARLNLFVFLRVYEAGCVLRPTLPYHQTKYIYIYQVYIIRVYIDIYTHLFRAKVDPKLVKKIDKKRDEFVWQR